MNSRAPSPEPRDLASSGGLPSALSSLILSCPSLSSSNLEKYLHLTEEGSGQIQPLKAKAARAAPGELKAPPMLSGCTPCTAGHMVTYFLHRERRINPRIIRPKFSLRMHAHARFTFEAVTMRTVPAAG